ncbi:hypothetical protein [Singulisphaera sp. PoT]|uniref:hypothetical protein n=1 Tax=Singulisphaera sp. PoT TaxID=3411797 RepID=UPI003BF5113C
MAASPRYFTYSPGPAYGGLANVLKFKVVLVDGSTPFGPVSGAQSGITESADVDAGITASGDYVIRVDTLDESASGKQVWTDPQNGSIFSEAFGPDVSGDVASLKADLATATADLATAKADLAVTKAKVEELSAMSDNLFADGTVSDPDPGADGFKIAAPAGQTLPADDRYRGLSLMFTGASKLAPAKKVIESYRRITSTTAELTFLEPFSDIPDDGDEYQIG